MNTYLKQAAKIAAARRTKGHGSYFFGAIATRPDGLIVSSFNVTVKDAQTLDGHAEARLASKVQAGSCVYVARVTKAGVWAMAKPCQACETRLRNMRVKQVQYTIGVGKYGVLRF